MEENDKELPTYVLPVSMDECGRILIPAPIRKTTQISALSNLKITVTGSKLLIELAN